MRRILYMVELWQRFQNLVHRFFKRALTIIELSPEKQFVES